MPPASSPQRIREQGDASSHFVIPTSIDMRATSPGLLFLVVLRSYSGPFVTVLCAIGLSETPTMPSQVSYCY